VPCGVDKHKARKWPRRCAVHNKLSAQEYEYVVGAGLVQMCGQVARSERKLN